MAFIALLLWALSGQCSWHLENAQKWGTFCSNVRSPAGALCLLRALMNEGVMVLKGFSSWKAEIMVFKAKRASSHIWEQARRVRRLRRILRMSEAAWDQPVSHIYSLLATCKHLCRGYMLMRVTVIQQVASFNAVLLLNIIVLCVYSMVQKLAGRNGLIKLYWHFSLELLIDFCTFFLKMFVFHCQLQNSIL